MVMVVMVGHLLAAELPIQFREQLLEEAAVLAEAASTAEAAEAAEEVDQRRSHYKLDQEDNSPQTWAEPGGQVALAVSNK